MKPKIVVLAVNNRIAKQYADRRGISYRDRILVTPHTPEKLRGLIGVVIIFVEDYPPDTPASNLVELDELRMSAAILAQQDRASIMRDILH